MEAIVCCIGMHTRLRWMYAFGRPWAGFVGRTGSRTGSRSFLDCEYDGRLLFASKTYTLYNPRDVHYVTLFRRPLTLPQGNELIISHYIYLKKS